MFLSGWTKMDSLRYFFLISSSVASGSTCNTSNGFKLKYVEPGRRSLSSCCFGVSTESRFSISLTWNTSKLEIVPWARINLDVHNVSHSNYLWIEFVERFHCWGRGCRRHGDHFYLFLLFWNAITQYLLEMYSHLWQSKTLLGLSCFFSIDFFYNSSFRLS